MKDNKYLVANMFLIVSNIFSFIFIYNFAEACKVLQKGLTASFINLGVAGLLSVVLQFGLSYFGITDGPITYITYIPFIYGLIFYVRICITLCKNFEGALGNLGDALWVVPMIAIGITIGGCFIGIILMKVSGDIGFLLIGVTIIYVIYYVFKNILYRMYLILNEGRRNHLTPCDLQNELNQLGYYSDDNPMNPFPENENNKYCFSDVSFNLEREYGRDKKKNNTKDWGRSSLSKKSINVKRIFSKKVIITCSILLSIVVLGGGSVYCYNHYDESKQKEEAAQRRVEYEAMVQKYFPGGAYEEQYSSFKTKGKFDGEHEDVLALFPVEESRIIENGEVVYKKLVIKSESGMLPDLEITPSALIGGSDSDGFQYDSNLSLYFLTTHIGVFVKGKRPQTAVLLGVDSNDWLTDAKMYYLKDGEWVKGQPLDMLPYDELIKIFDKEYNDNKDRFTISDRWSVVESPEGNIKDYGFTETSLFPLGEYSDDQDAEIEDGENEESVVPHYLLMTKESNSCLIISGDVLSIGSLPSLEGDKRKYLYIYYKSRPGSYYPVVEVYQEYEGHHGSGWEKIGEGSAGSEDPNTFDIKYDE